MKDEGEILGERVEEMRRGEANYLMVNVVSRRVRELNQGGKPIVDFIIGEDPLEIALREMREGKLTIVRDEPPAGEPKKEEAPVAAPAPRRRAAEKHEEEE